MEGYKRIPIAKHYTYFIHPIIIDQPRDALVSKLINMHYWKLAVFPDPLKEREESYFLPYVRNILYPTWKWTQAEKKDYVHKTDIERIKELRDFHSIKFIHSCEDLIFYENIEAEIFEIELLFLSYDTAFIIFKTQIKKHCSLEDLLKYNHTLRYIDNFKDEEEKKDHLVIQYERTEQISGFREYIDRICENMEIKSKVKEIYDTFMFVYNYTAIEKKYVLEEEKFFYILNHLISVQKISDEKEREHVFENILYYQQYKLSTYGFSKNSSIVFALLEHEEETFNLTVLSEQFQKVYMKIFLLALFQRITLLNYTYQLANIEDLLADQKSINGLRRDILKFTNTYKFSQISNFEEALLLWKKWNEILEIDKIYKEVESELTEFDEYVFRVRTNKNNVLLNVLSIIFLPFTVITGLLGMNIIELQNISLYSEKALWICIGSVIFVGMTIALIQWINKKDEI